jgi:hypothetical protein
MPTGCSGCHPAAIALAHTASTVGDLGFAGALSTAAATVLGIGYKHGLSDTPAARSSATEVDANQTHLPRAVPRSASPQLPPCLTRVWTAEEA